MFTGSFVSLTRVVVLLAMAAACTGSARADHYAGATISYTCLGSNFYTVSLDIYLNCAGVPITAQKLKFHNSCGVFFQQSNLPLFLSEEVSPTCASQLANTTCHSGGTLPGFKRYRYNTTVYLSPCNFWTISWNICCRNSTVNVQNTPGTYAEATLNNFGGVCDNSPRFADNGVPFLCEGAPVTYNPGASDPDGNQMHFSLVSARFDSVNTVVYDPGFSGGAPIPGVTINSVSGQLNFVPLVSGNYVVVIQVVTYNSSNQTIGRVMRDLMFVIRPCDGAPPIPQALSNVSGVAAQGTSSVALCNGQSFCADMVVNDANASSVITMTSNASALLPGSTFQVIGTNPATGRLCWTANTAILPVNVYIDISDGACPIENTASRSIYIGSCLLLPIELVDFDARYDRGDVLVTWSTISGSGSDHFLVERSTDGTLFDAIGRVPAVGSSQTLHSYTHVDHSPLSGVSYYRLRQMDADGTYSVGPTVSVYPDGRSMLHAIFDGNGGWYVRGTSDPTLVLSDDLGRQVPSIISPTDDGYHVEIPQKSHGTLFLSLWQGDARTTIRLPADASIGDRVSSSAR